MSSGIYIIKNTRTKMKYVGSSCNLAKRKRQHFSSLRSNSHFNTHLQRSFNKYGESNFVFKVVEFTKVDNLALAEQYWVDKLNMGGLYNTCLVAHRHITTQNQDELPWILDEEDEWDNTTLIYQGITHKLSDWAKELSESYLVRSPDLTLTQF